MKYLYAKLNLTNFIMSEEFFEEQLPGSRIKSNIVYSYFWKWAKVISAQVRDRGKKIGYVDFFCGPGKYEDGSDSTPLLILKTALSNKEMSEMLVSVFNDKDPKNIEILEKEIESIDGIEGLRYRPRIMNNTVGEDIVELFKKIKLIPSLIFIDPFGYKGLTLDLIASTIKDWGCDCIFFFNYNRINAAIRNPFMEEHINSIFGRETADRLRGEVENLSPDQRETLVLKTFMDELKKVKGEYSISFKFYQDDGSKTSHFIFFVSKHPLAYHLMKQTMAENCEFYGGVPSYEYNPMREKSNQADLFRDDKYAIKELADILLKDYKGKTLSRKMIYESHNIGTPYIESNYKDALLYLEENNKIVIEPNLNNRRKYQGKPTLGENLTIKF
jgi:three-Cys-motif partner protein